MKKTERQKKLSHLPQVDECLRSEYGRTWLSNYPRRIVLRAIRDVIDAKRNEILRGGSPEIDLDVISGEIEARIKDLHSFSLRPLINATGVVIHTNLGRSILCDRAISNMISMAGSYSNLEYDIDRGRRGKRYIHLKGILNELTGAEDSVVVNNNAAAVLICLDTFAKGREVIVSRGELVEIGGEFRIPEVMKAGGAILREVGTTNKTHLYDYENALSGNTALLLKVHRSNYRISGFTEEVGLDELVKLGRKFNIPVMADLGSGSMIDLAKYGIYGEPSVGEIVKTGVDLITFSGDKLLGGPQAGIILGKKWMIERIQKNPLLRAIRTDKTTLSALEATMMEYMDEEGAVRNIPTLRMLTEPVHQIKKRAIKLKRLLKGVDNLAIISVEEDKSRAGGGSLPEVDLPTHVVSIKPLKISVNDLEERLRKGEPPVIGRIRDDRLIVDMRTVQDKEIRTLSECIIGGLLYVSKRVRSTHLTK